LELEDKGIAAIFRAQADSHSASTHE
jgi:hypothetical protein